MRLRASAATAASLCALVLGGAVACSSSNATVSTRAITQPDRGLAVVASRPCSSRQLIHVSKRTAKAKIDIRSNKPGAVNTRKTADRIRIGTLLAVNVRVRGTGHLATTTGCWVRRDSHVERGRMTVTFLMNRAGPAELVSAAAVPPGAAEAGHVVYLRVVRR